MADSKQIHYEELLNRVINLARARIDDENDVFKAENPECIIPSNPYGHTEKITDPDNVGAVIFGMRCGVPPEFDDVGIYNAHDLNAGNSTCWNFPAPCRCSY